MLRVLVLGIVLVYDLAGCAPVNPGISPVLPTAGPTPLAATMAPGGLPSASSAVPAATALPSAGPTQAMTTAPISTPASTAPVATTIPTGAPAAATAAGLSAAATGAPTASEPVMVLVRSGGLAGRTQTWTVYADGRVTTGQSEGHVAQEQVGQVVAGLTALGFFDLQDAYGQNTQCRDCYNYRLTVNSGGQSKAVSFVDSPADMPPGLGEAMAQLNSLLASAK